MEYVTIKGIDNFKSRLVQTRFSPQFQPEILLTTVHEYYILYGAQTVVDRMKYKSEHSRQEEHRIIFAVDGNRSVGVEINFSGSFSDEQYKVIEFLLFIWFKTLFNLCFERVRKEELLMSEMDQKYYEGNIKLLSEFNY